MGLLSRDSRGFALSLDLLLAIIPLTIVLGFVAADMDNLMYQMEDTIFRGSTERVAADTLDTLLQTSGDPNDWEQKNSSNIKVIGLAKYDNTKNIPVEYVLTTYKVGATTPSEIQNILGSQYGFIFNLTDVNTNKEVIPPISSSSDYSAFVNGNVKDIVRIERLVLYSKFDIVSEGTGIRGKGSPYDVVLPDFMTNFPYNDAFDYWIYAKSAGPTPVTSATVNINDNKVLKPNEFPKNDPAVVLINRTFLKDNVDLQDNSVVVTIRGSPTDIIDVFIIQVPKGTLKSDVNPTGADRQRCKVQFYVWVR